MNNEEVLKEHRFKGRPRPEGAGRQKMNEEDKANYNCCIRINKREFEEFKEACEYKGIKYAKVLKSFMKEYVEEVSKSREEVSNIEKVEEV